MTIGDDMKLLREKALRSRLDKPFVEFLEFWRFKSNEVLEHQIEILVGNRHEVKQLKHFKGELNTAVPQIIQLDPKLVVYLDNVDPIDPLILTHEIGHWLIKLLDFKNVIFNSDPTSNLSICFNSMTGHVPVYDLQKSMNIDPQKEIDSRTSHNIDLLKKDRESNKSELILHNAILFADDLLSCSIKLYEQLVEILSSKHPQTHTLVEAIIDIAKHYDLTNSDKNARFQRMLIKKLKIKHKWAFADDVFYLKRMIKDSTVSNTT
jgi:hypothetical protein